MTREGLSRKYPEVTLLDRGEPERIMRYARSRGLIDSSDRLVRVEKPGEGNMNYTIRLVTTSGSMILKQSRPWVEKYPQIEAPWDRVIKEARFYQLIADTPALSDRMPAALDLDPISRVFTCSDLGSATDFTDLYAGEVLSTDEAHELAQWLSSLHRMQFDISERSSLTNRDMRALNHEHIFHFPLVRGNGLALDSITPGLQALADRLIDDKDYVRTVADLGDSYLADGTVLLQGDFFPGSWLRTAQGVRVIDPEFAFFGPAEFDAGVFLAHLYLIGCSDAEGSSHLAKYEPPATFNHGLMRQMAGVEIMRRLIGIAQLPLSLGLEAKSTLLERSRHLVLAPDDA